MIDLVRRLELDVALARPWAWDTLVDWRLARWGVRGVALHSVTAPSSLTGHPRPTRIRERSNRRGVETDRSGRLLTVLDSRDKTLNQSLCGPQTISKLKNSCSRLKHLSKKSSTSRFRIRELKLSRFEHRSSRMDRSRPAALFHDSVPTLPPYGQYSQQHSTRRYGHFGAWMAQFEVR